VGKMGERTLPRIIYVSKEAYRIYRTLCSEPVELEEQGGREISNIEKRKDTPFSSNVPAFFLAAALGIINEKRLQVGEDRAQLLRTEYIVNNDNYKPFRQLIRSKHDVKDDREFLDILVEYSEAGIRELYEIYRKTGKIDFRQLERLVKTGEG
jgi:hypothetical protein